MKSEVIITLRWHNNVKQETELSLTSRATRLEVSHGHQTWYHSICYVRFPTAV